MKAGSVVGAPESGGTTLLGAAVASVVEFTILKGMSYAEKQYVYHQESAKYKSAYSHAVVKMNNLVKEIQEKGLESISADQIVQVRRDLEQASTGYMSYFEWRVKVLEEERELARKEFEGERQEYLIDHGGRSVFEINQMYDEKISKLNREYAEEIGKIQGSEEYLSFQSLSLQNPDVLRMSPTAPQEEIPTIQGRIISREVSEDRNSFVAQHQAYEDRLITTLRNAQVSYYKKELKKVFPNLPDIELHQTVAQLTQSSHHLKEGEQMIDWNEINQHLQQVDQKNSKEIKSEGIEIPISG